MIEEEQEIVLEKAVVEKKEQDWNKRDIEIEEESNNDQIVNDEIKESSIEVRLADKIDWTKLTVLEHKLFYSIEEAPIKNQLKKMLTLLRVNSHLSTHLYNQTKNNFKLIQENYWKFQNVPIIFDIKEVENRELIVVVQHFKQSLDFTIKYDSHEYTKWQYDNVSDLKQFLSLGIILDASETNHASFVQTKNNTYLFNPTLFICKEVCHQQIYEKEEEREQQIEQIDESTNKQQVKDNQTIEQPSQNKQNIQDKQNINVKKIIFKSLLSCLSNILQVNVMQVDWTSKKSKDDERTIMNIIQDILNKERDEYVNLIMKDFTKNDRKNLIQIQKAKKNKRFYKKIKVNSFNKQELLTKYREEYEQLKQETQQQARDTFSNQNQQLYDLIIALNDSKHDLDSSYQLLELAIKKEIALKKKCMISLADEKNVKTLKSLLQSKNNSSKKEESNIINKTEKGQPDENDKENKPRSVQKYVEQKKDKIEDKIEKQKKIKINLSKKKQPIPKKEGKLYKDSIVEVEDKKHIQTVQKQILAKEKEEDEDEVDSQKLNVHTIKFAFSIYAETKEIANLYKTLNIYQNNFVSITLIFSSMKLTSHTLKKFIIPIFSYPNLLYVRLLLNGCFQSRPIFWEDNEDEQNNASNKDKQIKDDDDDDDESEDIQEEQENDQNINNSTKITKKEEKIQNIINNLIELGQNPNLEFFEIHLEKNYARDEDIDILFGFLKGGFKNLSKLELGWQDAYINEQQLTKICNHLSFFKDKLYRIGLTLWKNVKIGDDQVREMCECLKEFTQLTLVTLGLLECKVTNQVGHILCDLLKSLPFLHMLEIGLDDNHLNQALGYMGEGFKTQKLLSYLGISFQDSNLDDQSLIQFSDGLLEMYNLEEFHLFLGKNSFQQSSLAHFFKTISQHSRQLQVIDLGFQKNNLTHPDFVDEMCAFLRLQYKLIKIELCFDNTKLKGDSIAKILGSINRNQSLELLHLNLQNCSLNTVGFDALINLLHELQNPLALTLLRINVQHNIMNLNEDKQAHLGASIKRFLNLIELDLDFSGCHLFNEFFIQISEGVQQLHNLESYTLILHKCFLSQFRMKLIVNLCFIHILLYNFNFFFIKNKQIIQMIFKNKLIIVFIQSLALCLQISAINKQQTKLKIKKQQKLEGLANKKKLNDLSLEFQDSEIPQIDEIYDPNELLTTIDYIYMPELKQLSLNFLRCSWPFKLVNVILLQIGSEKMKTRQLQNLNSLNIYVCNKQIELQQLYHFVMTVNSLYANATELTLTFDDCGLDYDKTTILFNFKLNNLKNIDLSLSDNNEINMITLSEFFAKQTKLQYLGLKLKNITQPIEDFDQLGVALQAFSLKIFNLYFESSQLNYSRTLKGFYNGLATQQNIESITLHLHNIDHSQNQIKNFAYNLQFMKQLVTLNLHLPNSMLRKEEIKQLSLSLGDKIFLKDLILEFYKNEIIDKSGILFARSLARLENLQKLDFSLMRCDLLPCIAEKLCLGIGELKQLRKLHLYLGENNISSFTLDFLSYSMCNLLNLTNLKINLQETSIGEEAITSLAQGLLNLHQIIILDLNLENTDIEEQSLIKFGQFFRENSQNLQLLELSLRNNTSITENGFRGLMEGLGNAQSLTQIVMMFNHCLMNTVTSQHLPLCVNNKNKLKCLQIYFDENLCESLTAKTFGIALMTNCPKVKRITLCFQLNQLGNAGVNDLIDGIFQMPELQKATIDLRQNQINNKDTLVKMGTSIVKSKKISDLELLIFENQEYNDKQIAKGLFALAKANIELCQQMEQFDVRNKDWKDTIRNTIIPITTTMICQMQIIAFHNYISPILHYNQVYTIWDLYLK